MTAFRVSEGTAEDVQSIDRQSEESSEIGPLLGLADKARGQRSPRTPCLGEPTFQEDYLLCGSAA